MRTILVLGSFDLYHVGHVELLRRARAYGDRLIVALNTNPFIQQFKGQPPVCNYEERQLVLLSCRHVDDVIPNDGTDQPNVILRSGADTIIVGDDWQGDKYLQQLGISRRFLEDNEIEIVTLPRTLGISTTDIRGRLAQADTRPDRDLLRTP